MADILIDEQSTPVTPPSGSGVIYIDSTSSSLRVVNDAGTIRVLRPPIYNFSTAAQVLPAVVRTYLIGSSLIIPAEKMKIGSCFRWKFNITKTAAGTATSVYDVAVGTTGTTADTARLLFTKPAGTAVVDTGLIDINVICRGPLSTSGVLAGSFRLNHNLSTTGHATTPSVVVSTISAAFDVTVANLIVGICAITGTSDAITIQMVQAECWN